MMLLRFGRVTGFRSIPLRKTQSLQFCEDKKASDQKNVEGETVKKAKTEKKETASERLNRLLASMSTDDNVTLTKKVEIVQAGGRAKSKKSIKKEEEKEKKPKNIIEAAKGVANMLDAAGDTHQKRKTESELLSKLLNHIDSDALTSENIVKSSTDFNLNNIIVGMKIDRKVPVQGDSDRRSNLTRSQYVRKALSDKRYEVDEEGRTRKPPRKHLTQPVPNTGSVNLFGEEPLGIFKDPLSLKDSPDILKTWSKLEERELKLAVTHPPRNYFEKMILWTDQGKLWKFPIDNEQGLEKEQEVDFSEHVFLDQHLEGWCPTRGPIRHFMELVCIGLSKNPYISAHEKQEHIYWFKDYFEQKKELLKDLIQEKGQQEDLEQKQIQKKQINSITSLQKEFLGVHQQMSSRAFLHTKTSNSTDKTPFDTKYLKSDDTQRDREILFIGHSATWLPSEQRKVKIEDTIESNKKIVFVGHSATWIPTSPSKQRSTSFSTSAVQSTQSVQEKNSKENICEIKKKNLDLIQDKNNTLQSSINIQADLLAKQNYNNKKEIMKDSTKQNINAKQTSKIVESIVVFDKDTNSLKIATSDQFDQKQESMNNKENNILHAIKNFKIPEEVSDDIILSVPRYNLNKFITTIDPKSISEGIEKLVSEFEEKLQTNKVHSNIEKTANINSVKNNERAPVSKSKHITSSPEMHGKKTSTLNSTIPEKVVVLDKSNNKLKIVPTKEHPQVIEEANRQNKTLDVFQAKTIADYALKHWLESDLVNKVLKEKPVTTNSKDPDLPADLQKKIQEIRDYSNKMTRFSSKVPEITGAGKLASTSPTKNSKLTEKKIEIKKKPEVISSHTNEEVSKGITDKELVFVGNICYWIPKSSQTESKIVIPKKSKLSNTVTVNEQNKLFDSSEDLFKTPNFIPKKKNEIIMGDSVLSRIVVIDNRKNPIDLWKPEVNTKSSFPFKAQNSHSIASAKKKSTNKEQQEKGNIIESFGVPVKYGKENIQLKETPVLQKSESKQQVTSENLKSNLKSKPSFQAAQLEKHTDKFSNIENPTSTILKDGSIKRSFEPIKIVMNPIDLQKMTTKKAELKEEDTNKNTFIINKVDKKKDEIEKHEPLKSMQGKLKKDLNGSGNEISGAQILNTSADSVKLKSPKSKPLLKSQYPETLTNIEKDKKSSLVENVTTKPTTNLKSEVKSEQNTHNKENINEFENKNSIKQLNTEIKSQIPKPNQKIEKIDKQMKNIKEYKENVSNKSNFDAAVKSSSTKIVTDQPLPKSKEHFSKGNIKTSFSNTWSQMQPKPQTTFSTAKSETEAENTSEGNFKSKIMEEKLEKMSSVKHIEKSKHLKNCVKQLTNANNPQTKPDISEANDLNISFKVKTPGFVKENTSVKDSGKITANSSNQKDEINKILQKATPQSNTSKIPTTDFVIIQEKSKKIEGAHELKKSEMKNSKTKIKETHQTKVVENIANSSFVLIENPNVTSKDRNVEGNQKNHKENILNTNINKDGKPGKINDEPIILGPPKSKLNETKRPEFVLVNSASQTYSLAEPLIEKKSDTANISFQTKLNEEKAQSKPKIEPALSVDKTNTLKNQKIKSEVILDTVKTEVKIESSLPKDKPINISTQALQTEKLESENKMESILPKGKSNQSKEQLLHPKIQPKTEKDKSDTTTINKPSINFNNTSVKNLKSNKVITKTEQIHKEDQTLDTTKVESITKLNESKQTGSTTKIQTHSKEDVIETKSAITSSATSSILKQQKKIPPIASVAFESNESKKNSNKSSTPLASILSKNLEEIARKNGILKTSTKKGKFESINNHIFSYPELTGMFKPQLEEPKLIVDKSLPNRFNVEKQNMKKISQKIENIEFEKPKNEISTIKLEPKLNVPNTSQAKPELLKALSPLERAYNKIDKKLEEIQKEIELGDSKIATVSKSSIADPNLLKEVRENFKATKEETAIEKSSESSSVKELHNLGKTVNPKIDDANIIRKTYIPFSYQVTSPKEEPKVAQHKSKLEQNAPKSESPFLNLNFLKNYIKEKPKTVDKEKSDSIFKQVTNMIKEELFTYQEVPKETGKKTLKLAEESLASQPTFDGYTTIKPSTIYNQVKNMLKKDLNNKTKSGPQFSIPNSVIPGATIKVQSVVTPSILDENNKKKSVDDTNSKVEVEKSKQIINKSESKEDLTYKINEESFVKTEKPAVAYAESSVVPESLIVTETASKLSKQSLKSPETQNAKEQLMITSVNEKEYDIDQITEAKLNSDIYSNKKKFKKDVVESTNIGKPVFKSNSVVTKTKITNLEENNTTKLASLPLEKEVNKQKNDEEELYKILGISNQTSSRQEFKEVPKPAESVMDRLRNYFEKSSPTLDKSAAIGTSKTDTTNSDISKINEIESVQLKTKSEKVMSDIQSQSKVLKDSNSIEAATNFKIVKNEETTTSEKNQKITSEPTKVNGTAKAIESDQIKNFIRTDSTNNSPYHTLKPLSLLEHLTNMDTEQVKIDHHMKLLTDSRSNSISSIDIKSKSDSPRIQSPLLQAIEKDDVLMNPNPELVTKETVSGKQKKTDSKSEDKALTKSPEKPQKKNNVATTSNQVSAANEKAKNKKNDKVKEEEEEEEENENDIKKVVDKETKKSDKKLNHSVLTKDSNDKSAETKPPDSEETSIIPSKDTFKKDSVKPLDDNRSEPINIIESPGPSILDEETDINPNKISKIKNKKSDEPPINHNFSPSQNQTLFKNEISKSTPQNAKLSDSPRNITSENLLHNTQQQPEQPEPKIPLNVKPVDFSHQNQKFIRPSKPLIKQLNNVAKVNRNISSSVLDDFKIEMDRYNSAEATPEDKNKIILKIKYLTKIEPSESGGTASESLSDSSKTKKIDDLDKKSK